MIDFAVVHLSRLQFALTALYHFLFVPLTLGLSMILVIMESVYVMTGREIWKHMTRFWGMLFGINFAMGVATGITMEFQFGTNWAYYSHYVGDIFGAPLAIEGLMAFFLESTFVGLFFFGWDRLSRLGHLVAMSGQCPPGWSQFDGEKGQYILAPGDELSRNGDPSPAAELINPEAIGRTSAPKGHQRLVLRAQSAYVILNLCQRR
jgi:hypothetical protein